MSFAERFSLEATRPDAAEIATLAGILPPGTPVYLTAVPTVDPRTQIDAAAGLRKAGLEPIAHIAARRIASAAQLNELLSGLRAEADMKRLLVIGGDVDSTGRFEEIGIGGYPEGHPKIPLRRIEAALDQKIAAARVAGLRVSIVSQFSFSPEQILTWLRQLRACGISVPVKVGMAGPASVAGLLRYAKRCGVSASLRGLMAGTGRGLIGHAGPDDIIAALEAAGDLNASPHYFSFGGAVETARYACEAAAGRIAA